MDFHQLMNLAASKQDTAAKNNISWYNRDLPAPKKEEKPKPKSEVVQKLIEEKQREKRLREEAERERLEKEERKKNHFRIPKKKPEPASVDTETFINSLFDDSGVLSDDSEKSDSGHLSEKDNDTEKRKSHSPSPSSSSSKHKSEHSSARDSKSDRHHNRSDKHSSSYHHKSSSDHKSSSSSSSKQSDHKSSSSSLKDNGKSSSSHSSPKDRHSSSRNHHSSGHKSSSSSDKHRYKSSSSSDKHKDKSSSSSDKHKDKSSSSSDKHKDRSSSNSDKHKSVSANGDSKSSSKSSSSSSKETKHRSSQSSSESKSSASTSKSSSNNSQSTSGKNASSPSTSVPQRTASDEQPIVLNKHHLHPVIERHAAPVEMTEREKILARLQAIKQRTLDAIKSSSKSKQPKGEKSHRKSKGEERHDDKTKSAEIVREVASSDDDEPANDMPSVLDVMLSEHNARLEKEKIARMARQAWERAQKKDTGDSDKEVKVKKRRMKSSQKEKDRNHKSHRLREEDHKINHKRRDHSLSPDQDIRKSSPKPKKPAVIRRNANNVPPPMDFKAILAMAEQKQKEPPKPAVPVPKKKKKEEEKRPLTQEEKDRIERKKTKEYQDWLKYGGKPPSKQNNSDDDDIDSDERHKPTTSNHVDKKQFSQPSSSAERSKMFSGRNKQSFNKHAMEPNSVKSQPSGSMNNGRTNTKQNIPINENVPVCGPATSSGDEASPRPKPGTAPSQNPFDRIMSQVHKKRPGPVRPSDSGPPSKKKRFLDSEEEDEDSDLDGFIDDGDDGEGEYSKEIQKIFRYDRNKYKYENDDDLSDMEANFSTIMQEEKRSAKLGLMEDLEDIKREQEELRQKALLKKKMKRN